MNNRLEIFSIIIILIFSILFGNTNDYNFNYFSPLRSDGRICFRDCLSEIIGYYGEFRSSTKYGHLHAGIDIKGDFCDPIYSIGDGEVIAIFRDFPNKTVYIRHFEHGVTFTSTYIHVEDIQVQIGDFVSKSTVIGRIFNKYELHDSNFSTPPHLHLEIRHNLTDKGEATFSSMSLNELNRYCVNPITFFQKGTRGNE